ncbi:PREDICTED: pentatricopeptide repeat-containing [Prunus dulcis]|uniref:PREDICTED: pentatricopeptide repeat-containing n=1 Tax=Prunus dulcis TaxID=3755 RepID=A0A5E4GB73_PRUDU|nr:pentatricopeptide repeat-containing protein At4g21065-like [Prunus dulcis]VVA36946.1 PREDICTED: pentatricopeptide repeat-containing [Prunus dulcis]
MEITTMSQAMQLHAQILKAGNHQNQNLSKLFTFSALSPSGDLSYARLILDTFPAPNSYYYNTMIRAYSQSSDPIQALLLFLPMLEDPTHHTPRPDKFTYPFLLKSCARLRLTHEGKQIHGLIVKSGLEWDRYIQHSLIHMYCLGGESGLAYMMFDRMPDRDVVSWTSMIDGLVENGRPIEAIRLFEQMVDDGVEVNDATVVSVLRACAETGALGVGRRVHGVVEGRGIGLKANVNSALIDMYAKCGCIRSARQVLNDIVDKDVFAWTAMISGLASHGHCQDAIDLFSKMQGFGIKPDERTMTAVLSACRNAGQVAEGYAYLRSMQNEYGVRPTIQHYGCMVDLLARAGHLKEAEEFIRKMPIEPDVVMCRNLIWACKVHKDTERAERLIIHLRQPKMGSNDSGSYVLIGNVYASAGKWHDKARVRELMKQKGLVKPPGFSRIELDGEIHEFAVGDSGHPEAETIYRKLEEIEDNLRKEGYDPKLSEVLLEIDDEEKAFQLSHHSEKLALAFGLIRTRPGSEIRIVKNLRSCENCHAVMKLISKVYQREIIMRDRIRFHHFKNGDCSCRDYW